MKKLRIEEMEKIQGGNIYEGAACLGGLVSFLGTSAANSPERYILIEVYLDYYPTCSQYVIY